MPLQSLQIARGVSQPHTAFSCRVRRLFDAARLRVRVPTHPRAIVCRRRSRALSGDSLGRWLTVCSSRRASPSTAPHRSSSSGAGPRPGGCWRRFADASSVAHRSERPRPSCNLDLSPVGLPPHDSVSTFSRKGRFLGPRQAQGLHGGRRRGLSQGGRPGRAPS
jgi:hypothetical protein